ncbi:MAG: hypothetical protein J5662_05065 [Clostridia bacterium]|nr:hypothetical protein [Clostridia bacterium]
MSKKMFSKVIAMVCVAALCLTAVFTGAVSATAPHDATCTVTGYGYNYGAQDVYVTYEVKFESDDAFTAGTFTVSQPSGLTFTDCSLVSTSTGDTPRVYLNVTNRKILFAGFSETDSNDIRSFGEITLLVKYTASPAISSRAAGYSYGGLTISDISLTNAAEEDFTCTVTNACPAHIHNFGDATTVGGISTKTCSVSGCDAKETTIVNATAITDNTLADGDKYATLKFAKDGDTVLNALLPKATVDAMTYDSIYFVYSYYTDAGNGVPAQATATMDSDPVTIGSTQYYAFPCGRNGGIGRMSRNVSGNFFVVNGSSVTESGLWEYSIAQYADWLSTNGTTEQQNYAKALWNYGYYTTDALGGAFAADLANYTGGAKAFDGEYTLPAKAGTKSAGFDTNLWKVGGVRVTTGFKPKMTVAFDTDGLNELEDETATVTIKKDGNIIYQKSLTITGDNWEIKISDIPTKYLINDIEIKVGASAQTFTYGYGRYAKARSTKDDANVFYWMMQYAYYLDAAF